MKDLTWSTPTFDSLPKSTDARFRWAGSRLVDEEQYRLEGWQRSSDMFPDRNGAPCHYWRIDVEGCRDYSRLKDQRKADRKEAWQARQEADDQWSDYIAGLVENQS